MKTDDQVEQMLEAINKKIEEVEIDMDTFNDIVIKALTNAGDNYIYRHQVSRRVDNYTLAEYEGETYVLNILNYYILLNQITNENYQKICEDIQSTLYNRDYKTFHYESAEYAEAFYSGGKSVLFDFTDYIRVHKLCIAKEKERIENVY